MAIKCGALQGFNLGPSLFLLCNDDLSKAGKWVKIIHFAEDTNLFFAHESNLELTSIVNNELKTLDEWFRVNRLSIDLVKTNFVSFHTPNKSIKYIYTIRYQLM